jgi:hypothetical protein
MASAFRLRHVAWVPLVAIGIIGSHCGVLRASGNFHTVTRINYIARPADAAPTPP